jgi:hypothetical protein
MKFKDAFIAVRYSLFLIGQAKNSPLGQKRGRGA